MLIELVRSAVTSGFELEVCLEQVMISENFSLDGLAGEAKSLSKLYFFQTTNVNNMTFFHL